MSTLNGGPIIVKDGLVFFLDASNTKSFISGSNSWNDLTKNLNNVTLTNGPTFSSTNGGSIVFDGTNDRIDCGTSFETIITGSSTFSIECWVYPNSTQVQYADIWGNHTEPYSGIVMQNNGGTGNIFNWGYGTGTSWIVTNTFTLNSSQYNHLVAIRNSSNYLITYLNNIQVTNFLSSGNIKPNTTFNFQIGTGYNLNNNRYLNGRISNFKIYNRPLSSIEISQNYNSLKYRFGL